MDEQPAPDRPAAGTPTRAGPPTTASEPAEALTAVVARLRAELAGLRTAMRNRAVIEQAKGVLVERLSITPDESFDHLVRLSQRTNIKLVEVAAAIVGTTTPDPQAMAITELLDEEMRERVARARGRLGAAPTERPPTERPPAERSERGASPVRAGDRPAGGPKGVTGAAAPPHGAVAEGAPARGAAEGAPRRRPRPPSVEALQAQHQLLSARISAAPTMDQVADVVATPSDGWPPPALVMITVIEPDGAQRLVGSRGLSAAARSQWARIPPNLRLPTAVAAHRGEPILIGDPAAVRRHFPMVADLPYPNEAIFSAPLASGGRTIGVLRLSWDHPLLVDADVRRYLTALVDPVTRRVEELTGLRTVHDSTAALAQAVRRAGELTPAAEVWLPIVLETVHSPAVLLSPVWQQARVVDFRVEYANVLARQLLAEARLDPADATLLSIYPGTGSQVLLAEFVRVLTGGESCRLENLPVEAAREGVPRSYVVSVRAGRLWDEVLMVWRVHTDAEMLHDQLLAAERIAQIGSFSWDLRTGEPQCSPQLLRMYYGERPSSGAVAVGELTGCVHDDDLLAVQDGVRRTLLHGKLLSVEFRGAGRVAGRRFRVTAEPLVDTDGTVTLIRGTVQDVTEERALEARLRLAEEALAAQRRRTEAELQAARALQQTLLPTGPELGTAQGLSVHGRCRASDRTGRVDGDWFDAYPLPDGSTVLVVGDVAGSGLAAMTAAARLRYAVRGYAALNLGPAEVLTAVNAMLCAIEPERTATLVVARYEPDRRRLSWAAAGKAAPVRYRVTGKARVLDGALGLPVGAGATTRYQESAADLARGDRVILYTDGLVAGRVAELLAALDGMLCGGTRVDPDDVGRVSDHVVRALHGRPDEDMCAVVVGITV